VRRRAARLVAALVVFVTGWLPAGLVGIAAAQETARSGSELVFVVPAEPPSFDAHRKESFALIHPATPHYSTLLRVDPDDPSGTKLVGDLAEWWSSAANGRTWTFKIHRGVKFHDGSELTARDVKASYDTIVFPPAGVASNRKGEYVVVESVEAPDADVLARDIHWYEKNVVGTGRFVFGEYVKGSHWTGRKNRPTGPRQALRSASR
jgi:peptide/nickel transport system substrate-binding protein